MVKALVVEDEQDIRQLLALELMGKGYQVQEAGNGEIALNRIREEKPDIIFVDVMMPVMGGFDLISKLRENPTTASIPVVLVTALNPHETRGQPRRFGVEFHLTKPWEPWALECVVKQALKPSAAGQMSKAHTIVF